MPEKGAIEATREADRAEPEAWSIRMEGICASVMFATLPRSVPRDTHAVKESKTMPAIVFHAVRRAFRLRHTQCTGHQRHVR